MFILRKTILYRMDSTNYKFQFLERNKAKNSGKYIHIRFTISVKSTYNDYTSG